MDGDGFEISIKLAADDHEAAEAVLTEIGAVAVVLSGADDHPILEPGPGETPLWPELVVTGYFARGDLAPRLAEVHRQGYPKAVGREVGQRNWVRAWMDDFHPMRFGRRLWVVPSHCDTPQEAEVALHLDPGLAFGTGTHPTTALCLRLLDELDLNRKRLLDFGCGSGILAIAGALLGADTVGVDNDPQAETATRDNAQRNEVTDRVQVLPADDLEAQGFDVVVANILARTLVDLAPLLTRLCKPGGRLALSGILTQQAAAVEAAYEDGFEQLETRTQDEWALLTGVRRVTS